MTIKQSCTNEQNSTSAYDSVYYFFKVSRGIKTLSYQSDIIDTYTTRLYTMLQIKSSYM